MSTEKLSERIENDGATIGYQLGGHYVAAVKALEADLARKSESLRGQIVTATHARECVSCHKALKEADGLSNEVAALEAENDKLRSALLALGHDVSAGVDGLLKALSPAPSPISSRWGWCGRATGHDGFCDRRAPVPRSPCLKLTLNDPPSPTPSGQVTEKGGKKPAEAPESPGVLVEAIQLAAAMDEAAVDPESTSKMRDLLERALQGWNGDHADIAMLTSNVSKVYDHVTGSRCSKPNTLAAVVISLADDHYRDIAEADAEDAPPPASTPGGDALGKALLKACGRLTRATKMLEPALDDDPKADVLTVAAALRVERDRLSAEITAILSTLGPLAIRSREGNGPEDLPASLALSVAGLRERMERAEAAAEEEWNRAASGLQEKLASKQAECDALSARIGAGLKVIADNGCDCDTQEPHEGLACEGHEPCLAHLFERALVAPKCEHVWQPGKVTAGVIVCEKCGAVAKPAPSSPAAPGEEKKGESPLDAIAEGLRYASMQPGSRERFMGLLNQARTSLAQQAAELVKLKAESEQLRTALRNLAMVATDVQEGNWAQRRFDLELQRSVRSKRAANRGER